MYVPNEEEVDYIIDERKFESIYITFLLMDKKSSNLSIDG